MLGFSLPLSHPLSFSPPIQKLPSVVSEQQLEQGDILLAVNQVRRGHTAAISSIHRRIIFSPSDWSQRTQIKT